MRKHAIIFMLAMAVGSLLSGSPRPAHAQGTPGPLFRLAEKLDESRLQHDQARLQDDIRNGNTARVNRDLDRIRRDEWWLTVDRAGRRFGPTPPLPQPVTLLNPAPGSMAGTTTPAHVSVVILNPAPTRVAVTYVIDGVAYRTESGGLRRLVVGPSSTIQYDRGGDFGVQRYALSAGVYEFRSGDTGWAFVKTRPTP